MDTCLANTGADIHILLIVATVLVVSGLVLAIRRHKRLLLPVFAAGMLLGLAGTSATSYAVVDCGPAVGGASAVVPPTPTPAPPPAPAPVLRAPTASNANPIETTFAAFGWTGSDYETLYSGPNAVYPWDTPPTPDHNALLVSAFSSYFTAYDGATIDKATIDLDPTTAGVQQTTTVMVGTVAPEPMTIAYNAVDDTLRYESGVDYTASVGGAGAPKTATLPIPAPLSYVASDTNGQLSNVATLSFTYSQAT